MTATSNTGTQEVTVVRTFDASRAAVWDAWTTPDRFAGWFGTPPMTTPASTVAMDVRPGGEWRATMVSEEDGSTEPFVGVYREVVEPERLVFEMQDPGNRSNPDVEVATMELHSYELFNEAPPTPLLLLSER